MPPYVGRVVHSCGNVNRKGRPLQYGHVNKGWFGLPYMDCFDYRQPR